MPRNTKGHQTGTPVPGGSICARQHHTDTAARYRKVSGLHFVIFGIVYIWLNEQEEIKDKIARRVPVIARKSSQEEPPKRKRTGFLGLFGKKEEAKPTVTTSMLNTLNSDVIARQKIMLTVTHELRTPLTAINGYGELLTQTEDENKRIEYPKTK